MWKHLIFLSVLLGLAWLYQLDLNPYYQKLVEYLTTRDFPLLSYINFSALIMITVTLFTRNGRILGLIRLVIKLIYEFSLFSISLFSLGAVYWAIREDNNPWLDFRDLLPIPVILLLTAVICIYIIDFNQPVIKEIISFLLLAAASFLIVNLVLI